MRLRALAVVLVAVAVVRYACGELTGYVVDRGQLPTA